LLSFIARRRISSYMEDNNSTWLPSNLLTVLPLNFGAAGRPFNYLIRSVPWLILNSFFKSLLATFFSLWLFFYGYSIVLGLVNAISFGLFHWLYFNALRPIGDTLTLHLMHPYLYQDPWIIGAAVVGIPPYWPSRTYFRDLPFWFLLAWLPNMFLYLLLLRHGLWPTLLVYTLYLFLLQFLLSRLLQRPEERQEPEERLPQESV